MKDFGGWFLLDCDLSICRFTRVKLPKEASSESIKTEASFIWELSLQREFWSIINFHEMKNFTGIYEVFVVSPLVC